MIQPSGSQRGSVTAEFAAVIPAVFLVLLLLLGAFQLIIQQIRVNDAAAAAARLLGRGDESAPAAVAALVSGGALESSADGRFVCATVTDELAFGPAGLAGLEVMGRACALAGGQ